MLSKIKKVFRIGDTRTGQKIVINCEKLEARVALLENGVLEEYSVERADDVNIVGSIFKGRVKNIEHGLKAMFVDIGFDKNAFLHFWDAIPAALGARLAEPERPIVAVRRVGRDLAAERDLLRRGALEARCARLALGCRGVCGVAERRRGACDAFFHGAII